MRISRIDSLGGSCPPLKPSTKIAPPLGPAEGPASACRSACQIFRIVGQRLQILAPDNGGARVVGAFRAEGRSGVILHGELLRGRRDFQLDIERVGAGAQ